MAPIFLNMLIQKLLVSVPLSFLRLVSLLKHEARRRLLTRQSPRSTATLSDPSDVELGKEYPGSVTFVMQVSLAFVAFSPLNVIPSLLFFAAVAFLYKHSLLFSGRVKFESGGLYWEKVVRHLLIALSLHHLLLFVHFTFRQATVAGLLLVPPTLFIVAFDVFLRRAFGGLMKAPAQTDEYRAELRLLVDTVKAEQEKMLKGEETEGGTTGATGDHKHHHHDNVLLIPVKSVTSDQHQDSAQEEEEDAPNPYMNPVLFRSHPVLMLDPALLPLIQRLSEHPQ
jgi:hypothetical protein